MSESIVAAAEALCQSLRGVLGLRPGDFAIQIVEPEREVFGHARKKRYGVFIQ